MAERSEVVNVLALLGDVYPSQSQKFQNPEGTLHVWERIFRDARPGTLTKAAEIWIEKNHFIPTPSELKELLPAAEGINAQETVEQEQAKWKDWTACNAERVRLENKYWQTGEIDDGEWTALADSLKRIGRECSVEALREKYAQLTS